MENRKGNFEKFQNSIALNDLIVLIIIFFLSTPKKQSKRINEAEPTR